MDNITLNEMPTKIKWKIQACFLLHFKFWVGTSVKSFKIQLLVFLFLVLHQFLYIKISFLQLSRISNNIIWKRFSSQIFPFYCIYRPPLPFPNSTPPSAKRDKSFSPIFPKMPPETFFLFFQKFIDKILQSIF